MKSTMRVAIVALCCVVLVDLVCSANEFNFSNRPLGPLPKAKQSGMTFTGDKYCPNVTFSSPSAKDSLYHLYTTGANFVSIVVTQYQQLHNTTKIFPIYTPIYSSYYTYITANLSDLAVAIDNAHALGMGVMLKPQVDLTEDPSYWRGQIGEGFNATQWDDWFESYTNMILEYAEFAQKMNVEQLSVSCELITASLQEAHWRALIPQIRQVYTGVLTDAANWGALNSEGGEETQKRWWDLVDLIGVDAYYLNFLMVNITNPTLEQMIDQWGPVVVRFQNLTSFWKKNLILSEIGYCPSNYDPMLCQRGVIPTTAGLSTMALFYQAALEVFLQQDWFVGVFWWNWCTDNSFGGTQNDCMTPSYKPAEDVLRYYYQATLPQPIQPTTPALCMCTL
eukprot:TRINITY_DN4538_c0_g1_i2.p1 TRINITY_DN4538_c0_g1~~TRINITY_DN4538_c0_g1_i2.p1  ORF type:complete len:393 (-),score=64.31 TRINITY_DN4538_c0_g1_i2:40-1218(-)